MRAEQKNYATVAVWDCPTWHVALCGCGLQEEKKQRFIVTLGLFLVKYNDWYIFQPRGYMERTPLALPWKVKMSIGNWKSVNQAVITKNQCCPSLTGKNSTVRLFEGKRNQALCWCFCPLGRLRSERDTVRHSWFLNKPLRANNILLNTSLWLRTNKRLLVSHLV